MRAEVGLVEGVGTVVGKAATFPDAEGLVLLTEPVEVFPGPTAAADASAAFAA